jgi:hypothetical protein
MLWLEMDVSVIVQPKKNEMKNLIKVAGVVAMFLSYNAMAQEMTREQNKVQTQEKVQTGFVDEDGDGVNDNAQEGTKSQQRKGNRFTYKKQVKSEKSQAQKGFVDEDGDGFNDNAMDSDGDGIPNGQDPDYEGIQARHGGHDRGFVDADGDGINDNSMDSDGDGIPNGQDPDYSRAGDGSGAQRGQRMGGSEDGSSPQSGVCDETGPKGKRGGRN